MLDLTKQYETAKQDSKMFMKNGQISAYFNALLEMNKYKVLIKTIATN